MLNKLRLLTPGPTPLPEEVRLALARDMVHHRKPRFRDMLRRIQGKLRELFGSSGPVLPLASSGTGAMTAAVGGLLAPGQKVLVIEGGKFGERWSEIAESAELKVCRLPVEWGKAVRPEAVARELDAHPDLAAVLIQSSETSTGILNPIGKVGPLVRAAGPLLIVDGISAVGISPCPMDEWCIDCLLTGSQKGLMLPPGLALIALSDRAWQITEKIRPRCYYFNLPRERECVLKGETNFTSPVNLLAGLDVSLDLLLANGLQAIYAKQWALTNLIRAGVQAMGLSLLAPIDFAWGLTSVLMPEGVDGQEVLKFCQREFGVVMAGGQDRLKGRIIRIGHMGWVDWGDCLAGLAALSQALREQGFEPHPGFEGKAIAAYGHALAGF